MTSTVSFCKPPVMSGPGSLSGGASFECSLAGVVLPGQFGQLYDRLLGLCEHSAHAKMLEHELLFSPSVQRPMYAARNDEIPLRLRVKLTVLDQDNKKKRSDEQDGARKLQKSESTGSVAAAAGTTAESAMDVDSTQDTVERVSNGPSSIASHTQQQPYQGSRTIVTRQYQLCQYGHPEPGRNLVVRSAILVKIHGDAFGFLSLLGYGFEDEFVRRGFNFMYNNLCRISVFRKYKLAKQHDPFSAIVPEGEAAGGSAADVASPWLVEITSSFVSQENVNSMSDEINVVRNLLAGSISF